ncbi:MAG: phosphoribosylformylglycinamidine synthase subunit PurS [Planctomycetota bacterium]
MIHRIEVLGAGDPLVADFAEALCVSVSPRRVYLLETDQSAQTVHDIAAPLLHSPVTETIVNNGELDHRPRVEVHLKPGVMDPVAASTLAALKDAGLALSDVRTGRAYLLESADDIHRDKLESAARTTLANGVIENVFFEPYHPKAFPHGSKYTLDLRHIELLDLDDDALKKLSRDGHLFLSLEEMQTVQAHYRTLGREPTDVELETLAQTWSEHCVHKTLKSKVGVRDADGNELRRYGNLIKETIFDATQQIIAKRDDGENGGWCLSVFVDNAGIVGFDDTDAVCFKVETHNHPSALEPYGGAATGIGGVIRDVLGTGLAAKPVANTDVFCVAHPDTTDVPDGVIHPKRSLTRIVAGVRDYGNRMGIPTVNGAVYFDENYIGNPLVFCGCVGVLPRDKTHGDAKPGDRIVVLGGRTGRDGIHGATFSSAELTTGHADEFGHAVQIGNAITEKKVADVVLQARDANLFTAITDCGAGGLSSAVGEMGEKVGAEVDLDLVPLKYDGLRYDEIWISEAQERMVLAVPADKLDALLELAQAEDVDCTAIGTYGGEELVLRYEGTEVARMSMHFLHDGVPMTERIAEVTTPTSNTSPIPADLLQALAHPNVASKHWIIRQYDHEVQGGSVVKPLVGPLHIGPSDAAVVRPKLGSNRAVALSVGLAPHVADPYDMVIASIDEAIRNNLCVGGDLAHLALLDNFSWPSCDDPRTMGTLVRACEACRDYALAAGTPFISGKDSLHNQFTDPATGKVIRIPNTMLISALSIVPDIADCRTMDLKRAGNGLYLFHPADTQLETLAKHHAAAQLLIRDAASAHDVSDGGTLVTVAEMCIASGLGIELTDLPVEPFEEYLGGYVLESGEDLEGATRIGTVVEHPTLTLGKESWTIADLTKAWRGTLDW